MAVLHKKVLIFIIIRYKLAIITIVIVVVTTMDAQKQRIAAILGLRRRCDQKDKEKWLSNDED